VVVVVVVVVVVQEASADASFNGALEEPADSALSREVLALAEWLKENEGSWNRGRRSAKDCIFRRKLDGLVVESAVEIGLSVRFRVAVEDKAVEILKKVSDEADRIAKELVSLPSAIGDEDELVALKEESEDNRRFPVLSFGKDELRLSSMHLQKLRSLYEVHNGAAPHTEEFSGSTLTALRVPFDIANVVASEWEATFRMNPWEVEVRMDWILFACLLTLSNLLAVHAWRVSNPPVPSSLATASEEEQAGFCSRSMYVLGCGPREVCQSQGRFSCALKSDTDLADGAAKVAKRLLAKAQAFNRSTWATRGAIEFSKLTVALKNLNVYAQVLLEPGDMPLFRHEMQAAKASVSQAALTINEAWHRNGLMNTRSKSVSLRSFVEYVEEVSKENATFDPSKIKDFLIRCFPGIPTEVLAEVTKDVEAALSSEPACQPSPMTEGCSKALLHAYWGKVLSGAQQFLEGAEAEQADDDDEGSDIPDGSGLLQVENAFAGLFFLSFMVFFHMMIPFMIISLPIWLPGQLVLAAFFGVLKLMGIGP
ncbi:hypothetical protein AK812_SmicGene45536, partial [Symbiodinium microadriaticum]